MCKCKERQRQTLGDVTYGPRTQVCKAGLIHYRAVVDYLPVQENHWFGPSSQLVGCQFQGGLQTTDPLVPHSLGKDYTVKDKLD